MSVSLDKMLIKRDMQGSASYGACVTEDPNLIPEAIEVLLPKMGRARNILRDVQEKVKLKESVRTEAVEQGLSACHEIINTMIQGISSNNIPLHVIGGVTNLQLEYKTVVRLVAEQSAPASTQK